MTNTRNNIYKTLILRELLPPPIAQCKINNKPLGIAIPALLSLASALGSRAFLCLCLMAFTFFLGSCETYEDPTHAVMQGYFDESQGLSGASSDSISRFSQKVETFTTRISAAKNDPLYTRIQENIKLVSLNITITINDEWAGEKLKTF